MSLNEFKTPYKPRRPPPRSSQVGETPQPWTAARCKRLLRPLVSRISSLRKDAEILLLKAKDDEIEQKAKVRDEQQQSTNHEWLGPRKRIRLTYSQRRTSRRQDEQPTFSKDSRKSNTVGCRRQNEGRSLIPGEIVPATPLLRRARGQVIPSPAVHSISKLETEQPLSRCRRDSRPRKDLTKNKEIDQRLARIRAQSASNKYNDFEAIYRSLDALLKATRPDSPPARGPRSFLDMCLRKVPQYIQDLEAWERIEAEENGTLSTFEGVVDASTHIYNYLESIGPNEALGWKHLRVLVRADGLDAIKQGISEGLFGDEFSELLIDLCARNSAFSEAEELIAILADREYSQPTTPDSSFSEIISLRPLSVLSRYTNDHNRNTFAFRQYSLLLSNGNLPPDWLATGEFERIWGSAASRLSAAEAADDAITFISHSISLLCRRKRSHASGPDATRQENDLSLATRQTLTSALTMLTAMSSLGEIELQSPYVSNAEITKIDLIGNRLRYILRSCLVDLECSSFRPTRHSFGADMLHLALFLSSKHARGDVISSYVKTSIERAWKQTIEPGSTSSSTNSRAKHRLHDIASFISSIARSCGRGMDSPASHNCLDVLFEQLSSLDLDQAILDSMKAVAAFALAQQTNNVKDYIYAEKLASHHQQQHSMAGDAVGCSRSLFTGYRWEETIGEWVTASPVTKKQPPPQQQQASKPQTLAKTLRSSSRFEVDHSKGTARQLGDGEADSVPDLEIEEQDQGTQKKPERKTTTPLVALATSRVNNTKKRARPCDEESHIAATPLSVSTSSHRNKPLGVSQPTKSANYLALDDDELSSDKENWNRGGTATKKPRRSVDRRAVLGRGLKPRFSLASQKSAISMLGDDCSDDELCM
ncbi:uncharacterized protein F4822DRAFT_415828 [Hypoxylon trugodes]|uniref:uncharacterized protein n=1 Tax=Hypoxylon trugodes TaxID=326681 RepID=UPI00219811A9|nr:uncharacterized protein F4822DRAFT_415828 [Hypoxylon trugodes]KAI1384654.1 hypothetical protein F4822DRAFT_415828 [Hypoxylon trugodes]